MPWTEEKRFLNLDTPLGESKFLLRSFTGTEGMSQLFASAWICSRKTPPSASTAWSGRT